MKKSNWHSIGFKFSEKDRVIHRVESFSKVKVNNISLVVYKMGVLAHFWPSEKKISIQQHYFNPKQQQQKNSF